MKFHFEHIGPIEVADLELGDLTIIAGGNNTGKTYLVYTIYGFLKALASAWPPLPVRTRNQLQGLLNSEFSGRLAVDREEMRRLRRRTIEYAASLFSKTGISRVFNSPKTAFADACLSVELGADLPSNGEYVTLSRVDVYRVLAQYGKEKVYLDLRSGPPDPDVSRVAAGTLATSIALPDIPRPFILSAERFAISLFYKELDFTKSRLVGWLQQQAEQGSHLGHPPPLEVGRIASRYAMPVRDNIDFTRSIEDILQREGDFFAVKLHEEVKELMGGDYDSTDGVIRFKSKERDHHTFDIPLHIASSSARGLSDLYFYLRHAAARGDILFIDEPETHLDTANQVQFAHVISRLVQAGLKVLVSTHSDYLIKEVNNLVMVDHLRRNGRLERKYRNYALGGGLGPEQIRAYVAENNSLTPCVVDQYGIDAPVFDETIDRINRASNDLAFAVTDAEESEK